MRQAVPLARLVINKVEQLSQLYLLTDLTPYIVILAFFHDISLTSLLLIMAFLSKGAS